MSLQLAMKFLPKKYCRLQLRCQTYATCFATCNEIIFNARRVFKNVSGILIMSYCDWFLLKKLRVKLQWGCHATTCRVALRKVEAASTFSATCNAIFRCETSCKHGVSHEEVVLATCNNAIALQVARKIASCDTAFNPNTSKTFDFYKYFMLF